MAASRWMPARATKVMPVIIRLTTRVATASSLVWSVNSAHHAAMRFHTVLSSVGGPPFGGKAQSAMTAPLSLLIGLSAPDAQYRDGK